VSGYLDGDLHRDNEMRAALAPLALLAARTGAAVLAVRHLRKSGNTDALSRGLVLPRRLGDGFAVRIDDGHRRGGA
jgi:hypothetical protein